MAAGDSGSPPGNAARRPPPARRLHLVGSYPAPTAKAALQAVMSAAGPHLASVPDGETGPGRDGVFGLVRRLRGHPALEVRRDGDWGDYSDQLQFAVRRGHVLRGDTLELGIAAAHRETRGLVRRLCRQHAVDELPVQVAIPSDIELGLFGLGSAGMLTQRAAFADALVHEVEQIVRPQPQRVIVQLDLLAAYSMVVRAPAVLRRAAAAWAARSVTRLVARMPEHSRVGVHLCVGDLAQQPLVIPTGAAAATVLANAVCRSWPSGRHLEYVHVACAAGPLPPSTDATWYAPLQRLRLPGSTRFVAGILHERLSSDELARILAVVEDALGRPVDVAAACGLGRRDPAVARQILDQGVALCAWGSRTLPDGPDGGFRQGMAPRAS